MRTLIRGLTLACGVCGRRGLFHRWINMVPSCPRCGLRFERDDGDWVGAVGINTILNILVLGGALIAFFIATLPDIPDGPWALIAFVTFLIVPVLLYPVSKTLWLAISLLMRPVGEDEVRPRSEWE